MNYKVRHWPAIPGRRESHSGVRQRKERMKEHWLGESPKQQQQNETCTITMYNDSIVYSLLEPGAGHARHVLGSRLGALAPHPRMHGFSNALTDEVHEVLPLVLCEPTEDRRGRRVGLRTAILAFRRGRSSILYRGKKRARSSTHENMKHSFVADHLVAINRTLSLISQLRIKYL